MGWLVGKADVPGCFADQGHALRRYSAVAAECCNEYYCLAAKMVAVSILLVVRWPTGPNTHTRATLPARPPPFSVKWCTACACEQQA